MDLDTLETQLRTQAKSRQVLLIEATPADEDKLVVFEVSSPQELIEMATRSNNKSILLNARKLEQADLEIEEEELGDANALKELQREFKKYLGKNLYVDAYVLVEGAIVKFGEVAEWYFGYIMKQGEAIKHEESTVKKCIGCKGTITGYDPEYCVDCLPKKRTEGDEKAEEIAEKLSSDDVFVTLKNDGERKLYLKRKYTEELKNRFVYPAKIIMQAKALRRLNK